MKELVSVIIPVIEPVLNGLEEAVLEHCAEALGKYSLIFVASEKADLGYLKERYGTIDTVLFSEKYFESERAIDSLLLMDGFYERFNWCDFVLIHRLNSWIVKDELHYWCKQGYDFVNSDFPVQKGFWHDFQRIRGFSKTTVEKWDEIMPVGGVSLRNVERFAKVLKGKRQAAYDYRHNAKLENADELFWELETNRFFPELRKPTSIVRKRFSKSLPDSGLLKAGGREDWPFAITGVTAENVKDLPFFRPD